MIKDVTCFDISKFGFLKSDNVFVHYLGYVIDGEVVGYIEYNDIYDTIDIVNIYVDSKFRRRGIAKMLIKSLVDFSRDNDKKNITLEVSVLNDVAINLYRNFGFKEVAIREGYYKGVDAILMELIL